MALLRKVPEDDIPKEEELGEIPSFLILQSEEKSLREGGPTDSQIVSYIGF